MWLFKFVQKDIGPQTSEIMKDKMIVVVLHGTPTQEAMHTRGHPSLHCCLPVCGWDTSIDSTLYCEHFSSGCFSHKRENHNICLLCEMFSFLFYLHSGWCTSFSPEHPVVSVIVCFSFNLSFLFSAILSCPSRALSVVSLRTDYWRIFAEAESYRMLAHIVSLLTQ